MRRDFRPTRKRVHFLIIRLFAVDDLAILENIAMNSWIIPREFRNQLDENSIFITGTNITEVLSYPFCLSSSVKRMQEIVDILGHYTRFTSQSILTHCGKFAHKAGFTNVINSKEKSTEHEQMEDTLLSPPPGIHNSGWWGRREKYLKKLPCGSREG